MQLVTEDIREWIFTHDGMTFNISKIALDNGFNWIGSYVNHAGKTDRVLRKSVYGSIVLTVLGREVTYNATEPSN